MNYIRTIVSGKKKRFIDEKYNLDLSYITSRIIAMAFPASGIEKIYRNSIDSVSNFLKERHNNNYLVINLSGKKYDYSKFDNRVLEYEWVDHHAPPIKILFQICHQIKKFLNENSENIVAINCMAGKGRTGTIICCFMLYCGRFSTAEQAFDYYSKKRFSCGDGVTQPSQKRYVYYFEKMMNQKIYFPYVIGITDIYVNKIPIKQKDVFKPFIEIYLDNGNTISFSTKLSYSDQRKIYANSSNLISLTKTEFFYCFCGDITIKIYNNKMLSIKKIARIAFNSAFLEDDQDELIFKLSEIDPDNLVKKEYIPKDLEIHIKFGRLCGCSNKELPIKVCDTCSKYNSTQFNDWKEIHEIINGNYSSIKQGSFYLFGNDEDDVNSVLQTDINNFHYEIDSFRNEERKSKSLEKKRKSVKRNKKDKNNKKDEMNNSFEGDCKIF